MTTTTEVASEKTGGIFCVSIRDLWIKNRWNCFLNSLQDHFQKQGLSVFEQMKKINYFCESFDRAENFKEKNEVIDWIISNNIANIRQCLTSELAVGTTDNLIFLTGFHINEDKQKRFSFRADFVFRNQQQEMYLAGEDLLPKGTFVFYRHAMDVTLSAKEFETFSEDVFSRIEWGFFGKLGRDHFEACFKVLDAKIRLAKENLRRDKKWRFSVADMNIGQ